MSTGRTSPTHASGEAPRTTTVLVVGDRHPRYPGLRGLLDAQHDMTVVGKAADGGEAVRMCAELRPDVVVLDVRTPGMGSVEATRRITESDSRSLVLVLTTPDHGEYAYEALRAGAGGVCLKDARPDELVGAIRAMALGDSVVSPGVTRGLIDAHTRPPPADAPSRRSTGSPNCPRANARSSPRWP